MQALCKYYSNTMRLVDGIRSFSTLEGFKFFCFDGNIQVSNNSYKVISKPVTVVVMATSSEHKPLAAVLTNDSTYKVYHDKMIDTSIIKLKDMRYRLCSMLLDKYKFSSNPFVLEFKGNRQILSVGVNEDDPTVFKSILRGDQGDIIVLGEEGLRTSLPGCPKFHSFRYSVSTLDFEKTIEVRKNSGEILKEISHYVNRAIVLAQLTEDGGIREYYITPRGCLEVFTSKNREAIRKRVSASSISVGSLFSIHSTSILSGDIIRELNKLNSPE